MTALACNIATIETDDNEKKVYKFVRYIMKIALIIFCDWTAAFWALKEICLLPLYQEWNFIYLFSLLTMYLFFAAIG